MEKVFFTPGPTELYPEMSIYFQDAIDTNVCSINHRSKEFMDIFKSTVDSLKMILNIPEGFNIFFLSSATECMDRVLQNCVESKSFHFVNGAFAERFYKTALELEKKPEKIEVEFGKSFDFGNTGIRNSPELICITQNETSTGVAINPEHIYKLKSNNPDSLIAVDIVTSAPYVKIDYTKTDCSFFSVQKGFGLPAGLGVLIVNEKCISKSEYLKSKNINRGSYHNFSSLYENAMKFQTSETPNVLGIYLLGRVCDYLNKYGIENIRRDTEEKSDLLYSFLDNHSSLKSFVKIKSDRSKTIINIETGDKQSEIKKKLSDCGILVGSGYGKFNDTQIRIANFPMHKISDVKRIIEILS